MITDLPCATTLWMSVCVLGVRQRGQIRTNTTNGPSVSPYYLSEMGAILGELLVVWTFSEVSVLTVRLAMCPGSGTVHRPSTDHVLFVGKNHLEPYLASQENWQTLLLSCVAEIKLKALTPQYFQRVDSVCSNVIRILMQHNKRRLYLSLNLR